MKPKAYSYLRMSSEPQLKGDSRRRQLEASAAYAEAHGLDLANDAQLEDLGVSAFKGANIKDGALGRFLEAVEAGVIQPGSYLLVESLDRLSREKVLLAQSLFLRIIQAGINLVTLADNHVFRVGETDLSDLILSLVIMSRAHEESLTKSRRVGAAWSQKRQRAADGRPMTKWCPAWLKLAPDRQSYEIIPERAEIVRRIFQETAAGMGMYTVTVRLNKDAVPTFTPSDGWHQSYVAKILTNRSVLGEFQPHTFVDGRRVPHGQPVAGYFPAVITEELFFQAQHSRLQRTAGALGAGRKGAAFANLFSGIARCAYCNARMAYENKGTGPKGGVHLVCENSRRRLGCKGTRWKYRDFEASFLAFVQELDLESIISADDDAAKRKGLEGEISSLKGELLSVADLMEKTYAVLSAGGAPEFIAGKLNELTARQTHLKDRLEAKEAEKQEFDARDSRFYTSREEIKDLVTRLQGAPTDELYKVRAQITSRLKVLVETLLIAPMGELPRMKRNIDQLREMVGGQSDEVVMHMERLSAHPDQSRRYFAVGFRDAAVRIVFPTYGEPLQFEQQVVAGRDPVEFDPQIVGRIPLIEVTSS